ncbi:hypothetical protein [Nocardia yunnanensis]|uniref:hypothetical protein n=1 Tax=Nocardia yunnanensis TaxID=2382165 RepID=UPI001FEC9916|nr:hypothetical protein [Nocardia yunnanensis]
MSSIRVRTRADRSTYTQILFRHNGKQTSQSFEDHATALRWKKLLDQSGPDEALCVLEAQIGAAANAVPLLGDWLPTYIGLLTAAEDGTIDRYRAMVRNDFGEDLLQLPISALTETHVANWVNAQKTAGSSGKTIANKHGFLAAAMKAAMDKRLVTANPCANTKLPKWDPPVMTFLKPDEFRAILDEMPERSVSSAAAELPRTGRAAVAFSHLRTVGVLNPILSANSSWLMRSATSRSARTSAPVHLLTIIDAPCRSSQCPVSEAYY